MRLLSAFVLSAFLLGMFSCTPQHQPNRHGQRSMPMNSRTRMSYELDCETENQEMWDKLLSGLEPERLMEGDMTFRSVTEKPENQSDTVQFSPKLNNMMEMEKLAEKLSEKFDTWRERLKQHNYTSLRESEQEKMKQEMAYEFCITMKNHIKKRMSPQAREEIEEDMKQRSSAPRKLRARKMSRESPKVEGFRKSFVHGVKIDLLGIEVDQHGVLANDPNSPVFHKESIIARETVEIDGKKVFKGIKGLSIQQVEDGSIADQKGLEWSDLLISANGEPLAHPDDLNNFLAELKAGESFKLKYKPKAVRSDVPDQEPVTIEVELDS